MRWTDLFGSKFKAVLANPHLTSPSFSILHGATPEERLLMEDWIRDLVAFVNDGKDYSYGTKSIGEYKVMTPEKKIEVQRDARWVELLKLADHFSGP